MNHFIKGLVLSFAALSFIGCRAQPSFKTNTDENTLLWEVSGNGLKTPSYLLGTMHILCPEDAYLTEQVHRILAKKPQLYLELDMDNLGEIFQAAGAFPMKGGVTLKDLVAEPDYKLIKAAFEKKGGLFPFSMMENFKPMILSSMLEESGLPCETGQGVEMLLMQEARNKDIDIQGLETMLFQVSLFDSIPYKEQADALVQSIKSKDSTENLMGSLLQAYRSQNLKALDSLTNASAGEMEFKHLDMLLKNRNMKWIGGIEKAAAEKTTLFAFGAAHLGGNNGVINLLKKKGYTLRPLENKGKAAPEGKEI